MMLVSPTVNRIKHQDSKTKAIGSGMNCRGALSLFAAMWLLALVQAAPKAVPTDALQQAPLSFVRISERLSPDPTLGGRFC